MEIVDLKVRVVRLPFRFSFKHSLASRNYSDNVIVYARVENNGMIVEGYGESIPRDYVTGEDAVSAARTINEQYFPRFIKSSFDSFDKLKEAIMAEFLQMQLDSKQKGASWCALELALLDAGSKSIGKPLADCLGGVLPQNVAGIRYGAVIPFAKKRAFHGMLWFYKFFGFNTVKIKVGRDFEGDLQRVILARKVLGLISSFALMPIAPGAPMKPCAVRKSFVPTTSPHMSSQWLPTIWPDWLRWRAAFRRR